VSEDYKIQLSVKKGQDMLNVRANTASELDAIVEEARGKQSLAEFFSVKAVVVDVTDETKPPSDIEALENLKNVLGATPVEKPASAAQIAVAAKKSGKSVEELQGISEAAAKELIKKGAA
jgi:hypothetical protein